MQDFRAIKVTDPLSCKIPKNFLATCRTKAIYVHAHTWRIPSKMVATKNYASWWIAISNAHNESWWFIQRIFQLVTIEWLLQLQEDISRSYVIRLISSSRNIVHVFRCTRYRSWFYSLHKLQRTTFPFHCMLLFVCFLRKKILLETLTNFANNIPVRY